MVANAVLENFENQNYNDEQIKRLAAFFADKVYNSYVINSTISYNTEEWIVIYEQHNNTGIDASGIVNYVNMNDFIK